MQEAESTFVVEQVPYTRLAQRRGEAVKISGNFPVTGVTSGIRFVYYLIDFAIFSLISYILDFLFGFAIFTIAPGLNVDFTNLTALISMFFLSLIWRWFLNFLYYFLFEKMIGSTIGKLIFGYIVVDKYGGRPTSKQIAIRSISRLVPFEAFSCFSWKGWHDRWSDTMVISKKELADLKTLWQSSQL